MADSDSEKKYELNEDFSRDVARRREALGDKHVDRSLAAAMHSYNRYSNSPQKPTGVRSGHDQGSKETREHELQTHVRGAINNGASAEEIREVLMQSAVCCGFPTAPWSFRIAAAEFMEMEAD